MKDLNILAEHVPADLKPFLDWFDENYVGGPMRRGNERRPPQKSGKK